VDAKLEPGLVPMRSTRQDFVNIRNPKMISSQSDRQPYKEDVNYRKHPVNPTGEERRVAA